jgi:putative membrane protein
MMGYGYGLMGLGWVWMMTIPIALLGLIIYAAVRLANGSSQRYDSKYQNSSQAMEILNQKFANGDINEEEYKRKKELLKQ